MTPPMDTTRSWKGDEASYSAIHMWMRKHYPKTGRCEWCGLTNRPTEHARARTDRISRNWADWLELCIPCHRRFDGPGFQGRKHTMETRAKISAVRTQTHCKNSHEFSPENTYVTPGTQQRVCRACRKERRRKWRARKRQAQ